MQIRLKNCENTEECNMYETEARELLRELVMYPDVTSWLKAMFNKKSLYVPTNVTVITDTAVYEPITVSCDDADVPYWNFDDDAFKTMMRDLKHLPDKYTDFPSDSITIEADINLSELEINIPSSPEKIYSLENTDDGMFFSLHRCMATHSIDQLLRFFASDKFNMTDLIEFLDPENKSFGYRAVDVAVRLDGERYYIREGTIDDAVATENLSRALQALPPERQKLISNKLAVYADSFEGELMICLD